MCSVSPDVFFCCLRSQYLAPPLAASLFFKSPQFSGTLLLSPSSDYKCYDEQLGFVLLSDEGTVRSPICFFWVEKQ